MSEETQLVVPQSFIAVYVEPGRIKPSIPKEEIAKRYELCEDLAIALIERARNLLWETKGAAEIDILDRVRRGLKAEGSAVTHREADWVALRLSELLEWRLMG